MVSISKYRDTIRYRYQTFKVSKYRVSTDQFYNTVIPGHQYPFRQLNSLCRDFRIMNTVVLAIGSTLTAQVSSMISSIERNSAIVGYRRNYGIVPALLCSSS